MGCLLGTVPGPGVQPGAENDHLYLRGTYMALWGDKRWRGKLRWLISATEENQGRNEWGYPRPATAIFNMGPWRANGDGDTLGQVTTLICTVSSFFFRQRRELSKAFSASLSRLQPSRLARPLHLEC